ncbi:hypothetical protein Tco_1517096 [Tanacetum coccineum]
MVRNVLQKTPALLAPSSSTPGQSSSKAAEYQGKKKRRKGKDYEPSNDKLHNGSSKGKTPPKTSKTWKSVNAEESFEEPVHEATMDMEEPTQDNVEHDVDQPQDKDAPTQGNPIWFKQPLRPPTPDPEWNQDKIVNDGPERTWLNDLINAEKDSLAFDELMANLIDFSKFSMNRLKLDKITKADLVGPVYKLLKGTCKSSIELEYNMDQCYNALTDTNPEGDRCLYDLSKPLPFHGSPSHLTIPVDFFFNNGLEYLKIGNSGRKYIEDMILKLWSPIKVAYDKDAAFGISHWGPKRQLFYRSHINMFSKHIVLSIMKILIVVSVKVDKKFRYGYLKEIVVRRANRKPYTFKEGDFPNLHLNDIEDMLLLHVQHKLFNLEGNDIVDLAVALRKFTRRIILQKRVEDVQLGVESYQKKHHQAAKSLS